MLQEIFNRIDNHIPLSSQDALQLLSIPNLSEEYYALLQKANQVSKLEYGSKGYIFAQIGLNVAPCSGNCKFCSLAQSNSTFSTTEEKSVDEILDLVSHIDFSCVTALFLMTTADYDPQKFLEIGARVRQVIPAQIALVANTGDFDLDYAIKMREAGFTGAYHIVRLREGEDTDLPVDLRIRSLNAIRDSGLRLYYCLEPIGQEHTYDEMVTEMMRAREYHVDVMAAMRRVGVPGTAYEGSDTIDDFEMTKIVAVTRLVTMPRVSMNVHEPMMTAMLAGVNQLYAEIGVNPRDTSVHTENTRGYSIDQVCSMLESAGYTAQIEQ